MTATSWLHELWYWPWSRRSTRDDHRTRRCRSWHPAYVIWYWKGEFLYWLFQWQVRNRDKPVPLKKAPKPKFKAGDRFGSRMGTYRIVERKWWGGLDAFSAHWSYRLEDENDEPFVFWASEGSLENEQRTTPWYHKIEPS